MQDTAWKSVSVGGNPFAKNTEAFGIDYKNLPEVLFTKIAKKDDKIFLILQHTKSGPLVKPYKHDSSFKPSSNMKTVINLIYLHLFEFIF